MGDECVPRNGCIAVGTPCGANATCQEDAECVCNDGYTGDGFSCVDVDECETGALSCGDFGVCENFDGGARCECQPGYRRVGETCELDDACLAIASCPENSACTQDGVDTEYTCTCTGSATAECGAWIDMGRRSLQSTAPGMAGFWFKAPADMTITALNLPRDYPGQYDPPRNPYVNVVRLHPMAARDLPSSDYDSLGWFSVPFNTTRVVSVDVQEGEFIGVLNWVRVEEYGSRTRTVHANWHNDQHTTRIAGTDVTMYPLEGRIGYYLEEVFPVLPEHTGYEAAGYTELHYQLR